MRIGVLQCDDVNPRLRAQHGNYPDMIQSLLQTVEPSAQFRRWACHKGEFPEPDEDVDVWITTGSKCGANDDTPWIRQLALFIRELWSLQRPLVGICFGHQLMAQALGGQVETSPRGWGVGVYATTIQQRQPWMTPWQGDSLQLVASHQDQVSVLPPDAVVLAGSEFCPIFMMQVGECFLGIQGHPEFTKAYSAGLMRLRHDAIGHERVEVGLQSLALPVHDVLVAQWILGFMRR